MLFKYIGGSSGEDALQILKCFCERHTFRASQPTTFNDPFEFKVAVDLDADEDTMCKRFFLDRRGTSDAEYQEWRRQDAKGTGWWITQETRKEVLARFGVFCLSAVDDNHLMWSHYAANHRGFCVGIDEEKLKDIKGVYGHGPVRYQKSAPKFRYYFDSPEDFEKSLFGCKSSLWAYEREYRFIFDRSGTFDFPVRALKQVILGCRAYTELRTYANEHCEKGDLDFFQMREDFNGYRLKKEPVRKNVTLMTSFF